jgi:hypothetical protein
MLETQPPDVKPETQTGRGFAAGGALGSDSGFPSVGRPAVTTTLTLLLVALAAAVVAFSLRRAGSSRRQRAVRELLDAADALEARLRVARAEIEAVAGDLNLDPVGDAMREMLRQRLWLRDHGDSASVEQLAEVRLSIDTARGRIEQQLSQIERARAPLA